MNTTYQVRNIGSREMISPATTDRSQAETWARESESHESQPEVEIVEIPERTIRDWSKNDIRIPVEILDIQCSEEEYEDWLAGRLMPWFTLSTEEGYHKECSLSTALRIIREESRQFAILGQLASPDYVGHD